MEIPSINQFCAPSANLSGLLKVEYAPIPHIDVSSWERFRNSENNQQYNVPFFAGRTWLSVSLLPNRRLWNESSARTAQGQAYQQTVSGVTPKLLPSVTRTFAQMEKAGFVLRVSDRNGNVWLVGDPDEPLYFTASAETGDERGNNRYNIEWQRQTRHRAAGYVPTL